MHSKVNIYLIMGQETSEPMETNDIGQVKIVSLAKAGKWVWVNAKQCRAILKRRLACLKWEQIRKNRSQKESTWVLRKKKHSNKSFFQACGNNKSKGKGKEKVIDDSALYSPTSTPLTWSSNLYVKELLNVKKRLEVVEAKEHERDRTIHIIIAENQALAESNKVLKEQVALLQEALLMGKIKWKHMKVEVKNMKFVVENTKVINVKPSQDKGKVFSQIDNHEETAREEMKGDSAKD